MRTGSKLKPGDKGTKKLAALYGDRLVCVRYRYDASRKRQYKTVELIVDENPWEPRTEPIKPETIVDIRITVKETALQNKVKRAGGKWNRERKVWEMRYDRAKEIGVEGRIVKRKSL